MKNKSKSKENGHSLKYISEVAQDTKNKVHEIDIKIDEFMFRLFAIEKEFEVRKEQIATDFKLQKQTIDNGFKAQKSKISINTWATRIVLGVILAKTVQTIFWG